MTRPNRSAPGLAALGAFALAGILGFAAPATAAPSSGAWLVFDARTGEVVAKRDADQAWYPASITKLMTTWVTLKAIRAGRIRPDTPVPMTARASREPPSKMGFAPGQWVTVDNALKIIMVKSANDVAWALGEAVGGSKEAFVAEMNRQAQLLGMNATRWSNPNGLPDPNQVTTARDLGLLARALLREFPEAESLWHLPGIQFGNEVIRNHNHLIDHYPGADGMKTGFICSSGFNVVATASRGNRRLVAVVLGSRSARARAELAAELFTKGFEESGSAGLFGRFTVPETLDRMARGPEAGNPVRDMKPEICGKKRGGPPDVEDIGEDAAPFSAGAQRDAGAVIRPGEQGSRPLRRTSYLAPRFELGPPVRVWLGGADAAPPDGSTLLALAPDGRDADVPVFAAVPSPAAPGAIGGRFGPYGDQPPTGPGAGAGLDAALAPAAGAPLLLPTPAGATAARTPAPAADPKAKPAPARAPVAVEASLPVPRPTARPATAEAPRKKTAKSAVEDLPKKKPKPIAN